MDDLSNINSWDITCSYGSLPDVSPHRRLCKLRQVVAKTSYKECSQFQRKGDFGQDAELIFCPCICGEFATHHKDIPAGATDSIDPDCGAKIKAMSPTNAFGHLAFSSNIFPYETIGEYIRLSDDDVDAAVDCLVGLAVEINTCMSILTSAQPQQMHPEILNPLLDGLIEAAISARALILVDGFDTTPAREISKSLWMQQLRASLSASKAQPIAWAAIVSWGDVNDRDMLECRSGIVNYTCNTMGNLITPLNRYHNLFLMVDDGLRYMHPNSKIRQFRLRLEQALSEHLSGKSGVQNNLPRCSITVLVGGDYKSLLEIQARVNAGMPCVVCIGTGMAADILYLARQLSEKDSDKKLRMSAYLKRRLAARLSRISDAPDDTDEAIGLISRLVSNEQLLTFCNTLARGSFAEEILKPLLLFANSPTAVARLAKLWNRPDILQSVFAKDQNALDQQTIAGMLYEAVLYNQVEFVKLLLPQLKDLSLIRTYWVYFLYTETEDSVNVTKVLISLKILKDDQLTEVGKTCNRPVTVKMLNALFDRLLKCEIGAKIFHIMKENSAVLDDISDPIKDEGLNEVLKTQCEPLNEPLEQIFIACVFLGRFEMAEYIWGLCSSPLSLALMACCIQRRCAEIFENAYDTSTASRYREYADNFENLATEMVTVGASINNVAASDLVGGSYMRAWYSPIALDLAYLGGCTNFMSSLPAQVAIECMWTGSIHCSPLAILFCMFLPFLLNIPGLAQFGRTQLFSLSHTRDSKIPSLPANFGERCYRFYNSPRVKHHFGLVTYVAFLIYASYVILFQMNPEEIDDNEAALMALLSIRIVDTVLMVLKSARYLELRLVSGLASLVYIFLRFYAAYEIASTALGVCLILLYLELLYFVMNNKRLGPKVTMIAHMTREALKFSPFFIIFVIAFGVGEYSTLYPYKTGFNLAVLENTLSMPFYQIFGVNELDVITDGNKTCPASLVGIECSMPNTFTTILVAVYVMFIGVLIMNLLIALFSYIFDNVTQQANGIWKRNRFYVTKSFHHQEIWPWPLGVSCELQRFIKEKIARHKEMKKSGNKRKNTFLSRLYMYGELELTEKPEAMRSDVLPETVVQLLKRRYMLEDHCREAILVRRKEAEEATLSAKLTQMNCELDHLVKFKESERFVRELPIRYVPETFEDQFPGKVEFQT
uniref:Uncharacterized protein n=2 Tax=Schistocephalus solidus TaxID=70667 RepID=A0A0X3Q1Z2_SCHSO